MVSIDKQWHDLDRQIKRDLRENGRLPKGYQKGDKVRRDLDGKVYTVQRDGYWQNYAGGATSDFTVMLESIDPSQPTPWDKSRNLELILQAGCIFIGDCMIVPPGGSRTIPAKAYADDGVEKAIDEQGNFYLITYEDEDPIFTVEL